jgi:hypothetical protein
MAHRFHFFRAGGVDQVSIRDGADMLGLAELDQKLWVALAMPTKGIALDSATLGALDLDSDGRIRVQDVIAAIAWTKSTFTKPGELLTTADSVALAAIKDDAIVAAAKRMLADLGKPSSTSISVEDTAAINKAFAETVLNGDSIVIPTSTDNADLKHVIEDIIASVGSAIDRSAKPGVDQPLADAFFAAVDERAKWIAAGRAGLAPLGELTGEAAAATVAVRAKIDDFFTRCRVAAFDSRGAAALGGTPEELAALGARSLTATDELLAQLPLAKVEPSARLPLVAGINPAWASRMAAFAKVAVVPVVGQRDAITIDDFAAIVDKLAPYQAWLDAKPITKVDALETAWIERLAAPELRAELTKLIGADAALAGEYAQISAVTKAVLMQRDFGRVLRNFVNFSDFYGKQDGVFQAGTLYIDARAFHLCVPVSDASKHAALATASDAALIYCDVSRKGETKQIATALTNGDADNLFVGRNGIFYDRDGNDWDATITKMINAPISVRAAFWAPYKKLVKAIEDNVNKRAQAADAAANARVEATGANVANADKKALAEAEAPAPVPAAAAPPPEPKKIDLGTIAAIGVAIGGIGTLVGALMVTLFGLGPWLPFGLVAIMLMISGPSMLLAWLKLRRRNIGPILDANGWAINGRARINVAFGAAMTELPKLPDGAKRSLDDPFADAKTPWRRWVALLVVLGLAGGWYLGKLDDYLPADITSIAVLGTNAPAFKKMKATIDQPIAARSSSARRSQAHR